MAEGVVTKWGKDTELPDPCTVRRFTFAKSVFNRNQIKISGLIPKEIFKGPDSARKFTCGHSNYYRFAKALLIHELAHFYDHSIKLSDSRQFRNLAGWDKAGFCFRTWSMTNNVSPKSVEKYENQDPEESFAVSMEYFLLDPEFKCRRPSLYEFFSEKFDFVPFKKFKCEVNTKVPVGFASLYSPEIKWDNVDPKRVYQIHYLFASQGQSLISRWGHAMFRLVMCDPKRSEVGPACLTEDVANHLILSYRGNIENLDLTAFDMLTKAIPSQLVLLSLPVVINEYNKDELRDLISIPIPLDDDQKRNFLYRTAEQFWSFRGEYSVLKQNCATLALLHLKSCLADGACPKVEKKYIHTPLGLYRRLFKQAWKAFPELALAFSQDGKVTHEDIAEDHGYLFLSKRKQLESVFEELMKSQIFPFKKVNKYLFESSAYERLRAFKWLQKSEKPDQFKKIAARFFVLEAQILRTRRNQHMDKIMNDLSKNKGGD